MFCVGSVKITCGALPTRFCLFFSVKLNSAVQTPGFSPRAPAPAKKTPAPGKKLRLREKNSGSGRKHVKIEI